MTLQTRVKYQKDSIVVEKNVLLCECSTEMKYIGSSNCMNYEYSTHTYQCPNCKSIGMTDRDYDNKDWTEFGWELCPTTPGEAKNI